MNTLLFCFANDHDRPLGNLSDEDAGIDRLLDPRSSKNQFQKVRDSFATTDSVATKIQLYQQTLCLFHFSGHAGSNALQFEDTSARGVGIAQLLARCPELRLVFLNGCSTLNHIRLLADQNVKAAVIATRAPVNDTVAKEFAIAFYQALVNQYSLQEAVDIARLTIQVTVPTTVQRIDRGGARLQNEVSQDKWYFYCPDDDTARWELPTATVNDTSQYVANDVLRKSLYTTLVKFDPTLKQLLTSKAARINDDTSLRGWLQLEILRRLPYPISEHLRKLFCRHISDDNKLIEPTATQDRLKYYVSLFDSSIDLLMSILLSQIRNWLQESEVQPAGNLMDAPTKQLIQETMTAGWDHWESDQLVAAIQTMRTFTNRQQIPYFITELKDWLDTFGTDSRLTDTLQFLFSLKARIAAPLGISNIVSLCRLGEEHLSEWLKQAGFWSIYRLQSFKNIRAVRFYRQPPAYRHEMVILRASQGLDTSESSFEEIPLPDLWDCQSVLLVRIQRRLSESGSIEELAPGGFLSLAPFVIDKNVFLKSDNSVFDLYSFHSSQSGQLRYQHISRPDGPLLLIPQEDSDPFSKQDFSVLREQFGTLRTLLTLTDEESVLSVTTPSDDDADVLARI
ncbi:hypothetical protein BN8_06412 [Fibrisoma limi BUZ 3]|uniref:CHAT domain-containing protein n=1 Tax=Fibrisoma limi BUZ 3 TaxID=1185876 RepID=I2GSY6_9BACT|nr:CHAT domain-containing protein [Fibrisoma limi]CCH57015.1 hypothetical protein BN8_06412 [Fibrisoma limi BUZ 3]